MALIGECYPNDPAQRFAHPLKGLARVPMSVTPTVWVQLHNCLYAANKRKDGKDHQVLISATPLPQIQSIGGREQTDAEHSCPQSWPDSYFP